MGRWTKVCFSKGVVVVIVVVVAVVVVIVVVVFADVVVVEVEGEGSDSEVMTWPHKMRVVKSGVGTTGLRCRGTAGRAGRGRRQLR